MSLKARSGVPARNGKLLGVWCALVLAGTRGATEVSDGAERNAVGLQGGGWGVFIAVADK